MSRRLIASVLFAFATAVAASGEARATALPLDEPPAGIVATSAHLSDILTAHDRAAGTNATNTDTIVERWSFTDAGISGTEVLARSGANYHSTITRGPFSEQYGQLDGKRWHEDFNGFTSPASGVEDVSFTAVRVLEDAVDPKNDVTVLGETTGDHPAYVLQIKRPGSSHPEWVFYDKTTAQVVRVESILGKRRVVAAYDDFRTTDGITQAWHVHDTDGRPEVDDDWRLTAVHRGIAISATEFAQPTTRPTSTVASRGPVPSTFLSGFFDFGTIIVRLNVNGRGLDFELDASQPYSIIERSVAEQLGLPTFGQVTRLQSGEPVGYETVLPEADLGPAHLHDFRIRSERFTYRARNDVRVVGLLGSDFFAGHVVHIDYPHQLVEIFPSEAFGAQKPVDGGIELPIAFDDGLLLVPMQFGSAFTDRVMLSSAMPFTLAFGNFYSEHSADFHDLHAAKSTREAPFADGDAVGEHLQVWPTQTASLRFAIADFGTHTFLATNFSPEAYKVKIDAVVGSDYLKFFDLYFDYPHDRFVVKPNEWFYEAFKKSP